MESEDSQEDRIARLQAELQAERAMHDLADRVSRLEEQSKATEKAMEQGLASAKSLAVRAYAAISIVFGLLGFIGWTTISSAIEDTVEEEFEKGGFEQRIEQEVTDIEGRIKSLSEEVETLSLEAQTIITRFKTSTEEQLKLVRTHTANKLKENPDLATLQGAKLAGLKLTPFLGITPGITTRQDIDTLSKSGALSALGTQKGKRKDLLSFDSGEIHIKVGEYEMPFDVVVSVAFWGNQPLPLGLHTQLELEAAKQIAAKHFVWLGTHSFRGLVFSDKKGGPILLEIGWYGNRQNPLTYTIYGPL